VLGTQVVLVSNLPSILPSLVHVMPVLDIAKERAYILYYYPIEIKTASHITADLEFIKLNPIAVLLDLRN
jgi:hypothetical protein